MSFIHRSKFIFLLLGLIFCSCGYGQKDFGFQVAAAPNVYLNNLKTFSNDVNPVQFSLYAKCMWHTRYRMSFGVESGYVRLYRISDYANTENSEITVTAIPVHAAIEMKIYKNIYGAFSFGPSFIKNKITSRRGDQYSNTISIADISVSLGYKHTFKNNVFVSAEIKHYYSSKAEDRNLSIPISLGVNF